MTKVLVADDQTLVRAGFRSILESEPGMTVIGEAANGIEALELIRRQAVDVVLMDLRMPVMDGIEATRVIVRERHRTRVLVLTTFDADEHVYAAMRAGASGFLLKDVDPADLIHGVRVVARGEALVAPAITRRLVEAFAEGPPPGRDPEELEALTERELDVMRLVARGMSNDEVAAELFLSPATVKTHVTRILSKLELRDRVQLVVTAYEVGLVRAGVQDH